MSFARTLDLYLLTPTGPRVTLLQSLVSNAPLSSGIFMTAGDDFTVNIHLAAPQVPANGPTSSPFIGQQINAGDAIVLSGVAANNTSTLLFAATSFTENSQALNGLTDYWYSGSLNLNTTQLVAAMPTDGSQLTSIITVQQQNQANTSRISYLFSAQILPQTYTGTEGAPSSGNPPYPVPSALALAQPVNGSYYIDSNGILKIWNPTQSKYQTISITGAAGAEQLVISSN